MNLAHPTKVQHVIPRTKYRGGGGGFQPSLCAHEGILLQFPRKRLLSDIPLGTCYFCSDAPGACQFCANLRDAIVLTLKPLVTIS